MTVCQQTQRGRTLLFFCTELQKTEKTHQQDTESFNVHLALLLPNKR